jgi:hypothetical protein
VTYSPSAENIDPKKMVIIWDIRTGLEKRSFSIDGTTVWPIFRWSKDDKYFARIGQDVLSVYETPVSSPDDVVIVIIVIVQGRVSSTPWRVSPSDLGFLHTLFLPHPTAPRPKPTRQEP